MQQRILTLLFLGIWILGNSQDTKSIYPNFIGQNLNSIENDTDWKILQKSSGDLNNDGLVDYAVILESKASIPMKKCSDCKLFKNKPRIILVILNQNGNESVIIQNNKFIALGDQGGMSPYLEPEISIINEFLYIYYQYTRSNQSYTFEFQNNQMVIVKAESNGVHAASGNFESDRYDFKKREIISETGNISQEKVQTEIIKFDVKPKSLSEFEEMYKWKITEYKNL